MVVRARPSLMAGRIDRQVSRSVTDPGRLSRVGRHSCRFSDPALETHCRPVGGCRDRPFGQCQPRPGAVIAGDESSIVPDGRGRSRCCRLVRWGIVQRPPQVDPWPIRSVWRASGTFSGSDQAGIGPVQRCIGSQHPTELASSAGVSTLTFVRKPESGRDGIRAVRTRVSSIGSPNAIPGRRYIPQV